MQAAAGDLQLPARSGSSSSPSRCTGPAAEEQGPSGGAAASVPPSFAEGLAQLFTQHGMPIQFGTAAPPADARRVRKRKVRIALRGEEEEEGAAGLRLDEEEEIRRIEAAAAAAAQKAARQKIYRERHAAKKAFLGGPKTLVSEHPTLNVLSAIFDNGVLQLEARCATLSALPVSSGHHLHCRRCWEGSSYWPCHCY